MRVFVTGATGFIGQPVVRELLKAGHQVLGLARSDQNAASLAAVSAQAHRGSLDDLDSLKRGAASCDAVLHLVFIHDFSHYVEVCNKDRLAIEAMGAALVGSDKPFIVTSGTLILPHGRLADENTTPNPTEVTAIRGASERAALELASKGVRVSIIRLPPTNHGEGDHGFVAELVKIARAKGQSAYVGDGLNRWPATHRLDTAKVYLLALDKGFSGLVFHAVAEEGVTIREIAETIRKQLEVPVVSKTAEQGPQHFGWVTIALTWDNPASSSQTREQLGWAPVRASLIEELEAGVYTRA